MRYCVVYVAIALLTACAALPKNLQTKDEVIAVGPGPEDMVIDTISEEPRILISCNARRKGQPHYGEIFIYYPAAGKTKTLQRLNEPADLVFAPHGIDLVHVGKEQILLVVNHEHARHINSILRYKVEKDKLTFLSRIVDPLISSPNAVSGLEDGTLLISNDAKKQNNFWEPLFMLKRAQIIYWDGSKCSVATEKYCYTNGIAVRGKNVFLASTRQNKVWKFDFKDGKMINREVIGKVHGPDNIRFDGNDLLVPCHLRFMAFLKHAKDSTKYSPTTVYRINPDTKTSEAIYYDNGAQLSASSTSIVYDGYLYTSGVFDAKIVRKRIR